MYFIGLKDYKLISKWLFIILMFPFAFIILRTLKSAAFSAVGVIATEDQFSYVYYIVKHYSHLVGLNYIPNVAIVKDVEFDTKTISNFGKGVILINSELLDATRHDSYDWGALRFAIAREIGHISAGHRDFKYAFFTSVTQTLPYFKNPLCRSENYTADRYGAILAPDAAADYFGYIAVSKERWDEMSIYSSVAKAGQVRLGQTITGLIGEKPPTVWRLQTLAKLGTFNVEPICNHLFKDDCYLKYLETLPLLDVKLSDLSKYQGAFWFAPDPLSLDNLDRLCPKGKTFEIHKKAFES